MILSTHNRQEVITKLQEVADLFDERARNYCNYNCKGLNSKLKKSGKYDKMFSCELEGQRYYRLYTYSFGEDNNQDIIKLECSSVATEFRDSKGVFILLHSPAYRHASDYYLKTSLELRIFSGHYINPLVSTKKS